MNWKLVLIISILSIAAVFASNQNIDKTKIQGEIEKITNSDDSKEKYI